jgi:hypothetical protein
VPLDTSDPRFAESEASFAQSIRIAQQPPTPSP